MALQFVIGRAGSGKSRSMYQHMIKESELHPNKNYIAVVPEQYSMETQKEILFIHDRKGSFNIEVTSLNRLAYTIFEEQGVSGYKVMDDLGKTLVMRKVLEDCKKDLIIYKDKTAMPGFAEKMKMVVSEFKQYGIDEIKLQHMKQDASGKPILRHKLNDIEVIYNSFNKYIYEKMITAEDVLNIFCQYIPKSDFIKNTYFYFDGFTGFTPSQYQVLTLLMKYAGGIQMAVTLPDEEAEFSVFNRYELFSLSKETIRNIRNLADSYNIEIKETIVAGKDEKPYRIRKNEELCFIEKNIFRTKSIKKYQYECNSVEIKAASNPHCEAEYVASEISYLVVNKGYRYKDFAVITGDMEGYYRYLEEEFSKYNIPAFVDHKRNISSNPFVDGIKAAIEVIEKDFSYETVFHLIRLRFMDICPDNADILENYVLQGGKRGYKSYSHQWQKLYKGMTEDELNIVNEVREQIVDVIKPLRDGIKKNNATVEEMTSAVYEFIVSLQIQKKIDEYCTAFKEKSKKDINGRTSSYYLSLSREYEQAYEIIISLLDKLVALMGDEVISVKEYKQILQAGFESIKVGIIPPGLDTVMVGDIQRTRLKDTKKIIFFIGVNDGIIPGGSVSGGIITDSDREFLGGKDYILAPTARDNVFKQRLYLYSLLAKPTEKVCLTFSNSASDGSVRRKSYLINTLQGLFEKLRIESIGENVQLDRITGKKAAYNYVADNILDYRQGKDNGDFEQLCSVLMKDTEDEKILEKMIDGAFYKREEPRLSHDIAKKLYGNKENIGITRLERYAACAYAQFLKNGLKLGERARYELAAFDIGNLYHDAINGYFAKVQNNGIEWSNLDEEISHKIMDECVEKVMEDYDNDALNGTARNLFIKGQVRETAQKTVDVLTKHINSGQFVPAEYELKVQHGRIDRVDILETDEKVYVKVIDYKSGNKEFNISETMMGLQMQLMVYLKDAMDYEKRKNPEKDVVPAAGLYFHIHNPYVDKPDLDEILMEYKNAHPDTMLTDDEIKLNAIENIKYKQYRMSGLTNSDPDVVRLMDRNVFDSRGSSQILPVSTTASSGIDKKSSAMDGEVYVDLVEHVSEMAEKMQDEIAQGEISINPVENACTYCPYGSVCRFDRKLGDKLRKVEKVTLDDVKEMLSGGENHEVDR